MPRLYMRKETEVGKRPPSRASGPGARRARARCTRRPTRTPVSIVHPRVPAHTPPDAVHSTRHSTSVPISPDGKPDESKRHGWWHFAATLVQSRWRGWAGRRRYLRHRRAARIIQANYRRWRARCLVRANHPRRFVVQTPPSRVRNENTRTHVPPPLLLRTYAGYRPSPRRARRRGDAHRPRVAPPRPARTLPRTAKPGSSVVPRAPSVDDVTSLRRAERRGDDLGRRGADPRSARVDRETVMAVTTLAERCWCTGCARTGRWWTSGDVGVVVRARTRKREIRGDRWRTTTASSDPSSPTAP